jgi:hypothetical protein
VCVVLSGGLTDRLDLEWVGTGISVASLIIRDTEGRGQFRLL